MARVNHRRVKELKAEKRKTITDKMFFTSRLLAGHYSDIAMAQTRRYKFSRRVKVRLEWKPRSPELAYTAFDVIWINTGHKFITEKRKREERYDLVTGLFAHELGHVFYTPFPMAQTHTNYFQRGKMYPEKLKHTTKQGRENERAMWNYCNDKPEKMEAMVTLLHHLHNVVEDGYIENKMLDRYPGVLGHGLKAMREVHFAKMKTLSELVEQEADGERHIWQSIQQVILSYMKWGEIKYGEEPMNDERLQAVFPLLPDLDLALTSDDPKDRFRVVNKIINSCWPYVQDYLDHCENAATSAGSGASASGMVSSGLSGLAGATVIAQGTTPAVNDGKGAPAASSGSSRAATMQQAAAAGHPAPEPPKEDPAEEEPAEDKSEKEDEEEKSSPDDGADDEDEAPPPQQMGRNPDTEGSPTQTVGAEEQGRIPHHQTDQLHEPTGGETEHNDEYTGSGYTRSAEDIENLLDDMAERAACNELETERRLAINALAQTISYGDIHSGCSFNVHRIVEVSDEMVDAYRTVAPDLLHISKLLRRSIEQLLQDKQKGGKLTNLMMGRRLQANALHRKDGRPFYKTTLPNDRPEMAVALLLDESGSMCSSHRATYARASAIILHDFCRSLKIPVMVYGHSTGGGGVDLYSYAEFDAIDRDDSFRMMDISSRGSNRDGAALRFVAEQLIKRPEEFKMLMLVSDGQPADFGYSGTAAEEDLRGIKQEYKRKGVTFIAAAIGDDKENIKRIYGDSFLDITDLNKLPVKLTEVVKRSLRV